MTQNPSSSPSNEKVVTIDHVQNVFDSLTDMPIADWYRVTGSLLNIHLGNIHETDNPKIMHYDVTLYVWGRWEILGAEGTIVSDADDGEKIDSFIEANKKSIVRSVYFYPEELEVFIEFSNNFSLHVTPVTEPYYGVHWVTMEKLNEFTLGLENIEKSLFVQKNL